MSVVSITVPPDVILPDPDFSFGARNLIELDDVDAGAAGSADGKFLTELAPVAGERQFGFVDATVAVGDVVGLQAELDTKEATIVAATASDYYRGDKTFQPLNKAAVGLSNADNTTDLSKPISTLTQAALDTKLSNLVSPAASGAALHMAKSGTNGQLKKLIAGQDTTLSSTADTVTVGTTGRTLKDFVEVSELVSSRFYRYLLPNESASPETQPVNLRLVGRSSIAGFVYSFSLIDATSALKPNTGAGSVDLQIVRDSVGETASGYDNYVAGKRITVQGSNCIVLDATNTTKSVSGNNNVVVGLKHNNGSSGTSIVSGKGNTVINVVTALGAVTGNNNTLIGSGGSSGNFNAALGLIHNTGNFGLSLSHAGGVTPSSGGNRGMSGALTRATAFGEISHQIIEMCYTATTNVYTAGTWSNMTWDSLAAGTTNVYSAPAVGTVVISGYVRVGNTVNGRLFKVEAILMHGSLSQTITFVAGDPDPAYGSVQLVKSGNYIYVQIKQDGDTTILGKATLSFTEL